MLSEWFGLVIVGCVVLLGTGLVGIDVKLVLDADKVLPNGLLVILICQR